MNINSILTINNNHTHDGSMVLLEKWCAMDPINKNPGHMLAFFYQHHISSLPGIQSIAVKKSVIAKKLYLLQMDYQTINPNLVA